MLRLDIGPLTLHVHDQGAGPPWLFVHGFPLDHTMWQPHFDRIARTHRVLAPDLRGFGASDVVPGSATMSQMADDLADLLDRLAIREPVTFCGLSMGGYVAWQFWKRHPQKLRALILCDTRAIADPPEVARARLVMAERVLNEGATVLADAMLDRLFCAHTKTHRPELVAATRRTILATPPAGAAAALRGMAERPDVTSWLGQIQVPAVVVCGRHDVISPPDEMQGIARAIPGARYVEVPQAGHMSPLEDASLDLAELLR